MAETSKIEWTDATWNPITGCSVISPGCKRCYAMKLAGTRMKHHPSRAGLTIDTEAGPVWNGQVRLNEAWLTQPLSWTRPRRIFVCAHGDLFHEAVPDEWIDRVFAVMALAPQHTFQVLTKRADRMRAYLSHPAVDLSIIAEAQMVNRRLAEDLDPPWPLPNVWLGVSAEDQVRADQRIPDLMAAPAAVRFVSVEPLLGWVDAVWAMSHPIEIAAGFLKRGQFSPGVETLRRLDWVIVGGESGVGARAMHPAWVRQIRDDCAAARVPFFFKQWGEWVPSQAQLAAQILEAGGSGEASTAWPDGSIAHGSAGDHGGPGHLLLRPGKRAAGRLLDGVEHDAMPRDR